MKSAALSAVALIIAVSFSVATFAQETVPPPPAPAPPAPPTAPAAPPGEMKPEGSQKMDRAARKAERKAQRKAERERRKADRKAEKERRKAERKARKEARGKGGDNHDKNEGERQGEDAKD